MEFRVKGLQIEDEKTFLLDDPYGSVVIAHKASCFFCGHLNDIFWDYENGPYVFMCDKEIMVDSDYLAHGGCSSFEPDDLGGNYGN